MMRSIMTEFRVGIFVTAGLFLAMLVIFMLGSEQQFFQRQYTLYANFDDIGGLRVGAPVQLAGLKVGFVDGIRLQPDVERQQITVKLRVKRTFQDRIREDSVASIETQGLLGDKYIFITMGSGAQAVLPDKGMIQTKKTTSIFALADKAGDIMENIDEASKSIKDMFSGFKGEKGESDFKTMISSLRKTIEQVEKGKGLAHALFYDPKGEQVVADLGRAIKAIGDVATRADEEGGTPGLLVNMRHASADLRSILGSIKRGEGTLGKLISDPALYDDLRALVGRANRNALLRAVVRSTIEENERQVLK
jgi:phospholipid/cholesterol/gamma-HCH transport system substrate-binding protein